MELSHITLLLMGNKIELSNETLIREWSRPLIQLLFRLLIYTCINIAHETKLRMDIANKYYFGLLQYMRSNILSTCPLLCRSGRVTALHAKISGLMVEQNLNRQFLFHNITLLNPKSLRSAYEVKAHVLLTTIRLSDADIKPDGPLVLFENSRLMPVLSFRFTLPHFIFITDTFHHNTKFTHINSTKTSSQIYNYTSSIGAESLIVPTLFAVYWGPFVKVALRVDIRFISHHIRCQYLWIFL